ncbi:MAG: tetratricopeptide repeat protein [Saprospiraceae bacterium]|nr:tetratricopeptide repeat protein [Saprospiraceae bacterium]
MKTSSLYPALLILSIISCLSDGISEDESKTLVRSSVPEIQQITYLIEKDPNDAILWQQRGILHYELQKYQEAIGDLKKSLTLDSSKLDVWHLLADSYLDDLQSRKALETMEYASSLFPDSIRSLLKLSEFQLILRQYNSALQSLSRIQSLDHDNADAFFMKGMVLKEVGDTLTSITQFQEATKMNPRMADAWINLGQLFEARNDPDAIRYYDAGLAVDRYNTHLLHAKAQFLGREGDVEAAKTLYGELINIDPLSAESYYDLGLLFLDQDSTVQAQQHFDLSLKINPMLARAYFYRGWTHEILEETEAARLDYQQALRLNKDDVDAEAGLERLGS